MSNLEEKEMRTKLVLRNYDSIKNYMGNYIYNMTLWVSVPCPPGLYIYGVNLPLLKRQK